MKIVTGLAFVALLIIGLYLIPNILRKYKAGVTALIATLASGFTFALIAALVIVEAPNYLNKATPPVDAFVLGLLPIVIGCAVVNFVIAQVLYIPAKKAMR
jgi:multisubunit Na+/H+ antiporter MnhG subunit